MCGGQSCCWVEVELPHSGVLAAFGFQDRRACCCDLRSVIIVDSRTFLVENCCVSRVCQFGILISAKWSPGTMFISIAASRRLCFSSIFFVAFPVCPSGNIKVFLDGCPVSARDPVHPLLGLLWRLLPSIGKQTALAFCCVVFSPNALLPYWVRFLYQ